MSKNRGQFHSAFSASKSHKLFNMFAPSKWYLNVKVSSRRIMAAWRAPVHWSSSYLPIEKFSWWKFRAIFHVFKANANVQQLLVILLQYNIMIAWNEWSTSNRFARHDAKTDAEATTTKLNGIFPNKISSAIWLWHLQFLLVYFE